jgi:purine-binding chemotaxis protein CheW
MRVATVANGIGTAPAEAGQYLTFSLGGELYGLDILRVQEIRGWERVRALPDVAPHILGVLDLRGTVVPIVDLRLRFRLPAPECTPTTVVIVLAVRDDAGQHRVVGAVVDGVSDVLDVDGAVLRDASGLGRRISARYLRGVADAQGRMVVLLDVDRLFAAGELSLADPPA